MSIGNLKDNGNKGNNFPYQLAVLQLLGEIRDCVCNGPTPPYVPPVFTAFSISGQPTTVEVGTVIGAGNKPFSWNITLNDGVVPTINIYDNTLATTLIAGTPNDGSQSVPAGAVNFINDGQTQSYKGIGNNTSPVGTFDSANFVITARYLEFYGPTAVASANSAAVRALPSSRFTSAGSSFSMNTGAVEKIFEICVPSTITLVSVFDVTAGFFITGSFILVNVNVNDAGGTPVVYNVYRLTNAVPYAIGHTFNIVTT
jgi:hypothetical protein